MSYKFKINVHNTSILDNTFVKEVIDSMENVDATYYTTDPHLFAHGEEGYPLPVESNVLFICDPRLYGAGDKYGGLTFPGGRGGGCSVYVYDDYDGTPIQQYKYSLRLVHELLHLFDKDSDKCEAWLQKSSKVLYRLLWAIFKGNGELYPIMFIQDQFYDYLLLELQREINTKGLTRVTLPYVPTDH